MTGFARRVVAHRILVLIGWAVLAIAGGAAAPHATSALSYDFSLPGQPGYETNQQIVHAFGSGGDNPPVLIVVGDGQHPVARTTAAPIVKAVAAASPGARIASYADQPGLRSADGRTAVVLVYPEPQPGADAYARALPRLQAAVERASRSQRLPVVVTGQDALAAAKGSGGAGVLFETLFGGIGALVVLLLVFGSALAVLPLAVAGASILTTFLILWGLTAVTDVSFIVQYLLALIGLGVAIDYALLIVTRWREERGRGLDNTAAVERAIVTAGRSVLFSGVTVAVSLAALIALPVPFLRSVGFTGLLIPLLSVAAALTLLPALLLVAGDRLSWPHRRSADPQSRLWHRVGTAVVAHRWASAAGASLLLLLLAAPVLGLQLGQPASTSLASGAGPAATGITRLTRSHIGNGLTLPVEITTSQPDRTIAAVSRIGGVAGVAHPADWSRTGESVVDVWAATDASTTSGRQTVTAVRTAAEAAGGHAGGVPVQDADFISAVYGDAWLIVLIIVIATFLLLAVALKSLVLPIKALVLNVLSIAAAYGVTVLIWQHGWGTELLFDRARAGAITTWIPIAVFAFLFGLSMDYEVFLLSRIREAHDTGADTDAATVDGVARTGRLVTSAALILFLAFVSLSRVPTTDVKILATGLALGIVIDATIVRGVLAPALVAALGPANWWRPRRKPTRPSPTGVPR